MGGRHLRFDPPGRGGWAAPDLGSNGAAGQFSAADLMTMLNIDVGG